MDPIQYPNAVFDDGQQAWISAAEVAEIGFTAFTSRRTADHLTARLIVRRVKRLNPHASAQGELVPGYRYHAVFTDSTLGLVQAEACHRDHAHIEQVIADLKDGALAHAPSGSFTANSAWLVLAAIAFNLTRAAARIASQTLSASGLQVSIRYLAIGASAHEQPVGARGVTPGFYSLFSDRCFSTEIVIRSTATRGEFLFAIWR